MAGPVSVLAAEVVDVLEHETSAKAARAVAARTARRMGRSLDR
jgi:hypothetical protein